ncbi:MAG TPA: DUF488 domain-containing protein [Gammaproteobacteria bacterium]|nr:DUF488 domain-containing protein [Gammaproteobacteria bacterium]
MQAAKRIYTIGHSTHPIEEFLAMLRHFGIEVLADIRTVPQSRHNPQFGQESLRQSLQGAGLEYVHMKNLGGLRSTTKDSLNTGWRNKSFRGFADYMQTAEFGQGLDELIETAARKTTVIMCAEAVPWRCHRSLVGDALLVRGVEVIDIMGEEKSRPHTLTPFAKVEGTAITYP